jgi:hypothetical protein
VWRYEENSKYHAYLTVRVSLVLCRPLLFLKKTFCFEQLALDSTRHFAVTLPDVQ